MSKTRPPYASEFRRQMVDPDFSRGVFEALDLRVIGLI